MASHVFRGVKTDSNAISYGMDIGAKNQIITILQEQKHKKAGST